MTDHDNRWLTLPITLPLRGPRDVVLCRERARSLADCVGAGVEEQFGLAAAVFEVARIVLYFGVDGVATFGIAAGSEGSAQDLVAVISDTGKGNRNLELVFRGGCGTEVGEDLGVQPIRELVDDLQIESGPAGTTVTIIHRLKKVMMRSELERNISGITANDTVDPLRELALQNRESIQILQSLRRQREEFVQVTGELTETNRGVVALYDELETVARIGRVIAAQLDLSSLLQAITEATTDISCAELGAFFYKEPNEPQFRCHTIAGVLHFALRHCPPVEQSDLFGECSPSETLRIDDLETTAVHLLVCSHLPLRSYLAVPVMDSSGDIAGALVFCHREPHKFSERCERILLGVAEQISANIQNARLYRTVQSASAAKDQFLAMLSHELRTPLSPVFATLTLLEQDASETSELKRHLEVIRRNLDLEARLIDDLLDVTKIVKGKFGVSRQRIDLHTLLKHTGETWARQSESSGVTVRFMPEAADARVLGDPVRLQQVFWNLVNNAIKFSSPGSEVILRTRNEDGMICIEVSDTGRGIEPAKLQSIFQPFDQGDLSGNGEFAGLGLGLAIVRGVVEAHGGSISAESCGLGTGACFVVRLKLDTTEEVKSAIGSTPGTSQEQRRGLRILLVDDHLETLDTLGRLLMRQGHLVTPAASVESAVELAQVQDFDLLISDIGLGDRSGLELMMHMREHYQLSGIALSGYGMEADIMRSREAGFDEHLVKPVDFQKLLCAINEVCTSSIEQCREMIE